MYLAARDGQVDVVHILLGNIPDINEAGEFCITSQWAFR
jgi:hypothetical protein